MVPYCYYTAAVSRKPKVFFVRFLAYFIDSKKPIEAQLKEFSIEDFNIFFSKVILKLQ